MASKTKVKLTRRHACIIAIVIATLVMVLDAGFCIGTGVFASDGPGGRSGAMSAEGSMAPPSDGMESPSGSRTSGESMSNSVTSDPGGDSADASENPSESSDADSAGERKSEDDGTPGAVSQQSGGSTSGEPPAGSRPSGGRPGSNRGLSTLAYAAIALFALCLIVDIVSAIGLVRLRKRDKEGAEAQDGPAHAADKPVDPVLLRQQKQRRQRIIGAIALAIIIVTVVALQLIGGNSGQTSGATVDEHVVSGTAEAGTISKTLRASGILASADDESISVPGAIKVTEYHVSTGDAVKKGDIIATVDQESVLAAVADIKDLIDDLDAEAAELQDSSASTEVTASASGTMVKLYAEAGEKVTDVMYDHGALAVLSLDGLLAIDVDNNGSLHVGDSVTVVGDNATADGTVADIEKDTVTITVAIGELAFGDKVNVFDSAGAKLGTGKLAGHNQQNITGYSGTVSYANVSEGSTVSAGDTLLTLTDVDNSANYQTLLRRRKILVNQSNALAKISKTGYVCAEEDGVISSLNEDILISDATAGTAKTSTSSTTSTSATTTSANTTTASFETTRAISRRASVTTPYSSYRTTAFSKGGNAAGMHLATSKSPTTSAQSEMAAQAEEPASSESSEPSATPEIKQELVTKTVNVIWTSSDGTALSDGLPDSVTVRIAANGADVDSATLGEGNDWSASFEVDKYDENGDQISYAISLDGSVDGFSSSSSTSGNKTNIIMRKDADSSSEDEEDSSSSASSASSASSTSSGSSGKKSSDAASGRSAAPGGSRSGNAAGKSGAASAAAQSSSAASAGASSGSSEQVTTEGSTLEDATDEENSYAYDETTLGTLTPNDTVSVDVAIDELDINSIVVGTDVSVTLDALSGQSFQGTISALDPSGTNSGGNTKYTVTVSMDKQENMLLGMTASANIDLETHEGVVTVPEAAIVEQNGKTYLYTSYDEASGELGNMVEISTGIADGESAEVTSGLESGQAYYYRYADTISYTFAKK